MASERSGGLLPDFNHWFCWLQSHISNNFLSQLTSLAKCTKSNAFLTNKYINNWLKQATDQQAISEFPKASVSKRGYVLSLSLRSTRLRPISEQRKTEERDSRFWLREKWNESHFSALFDSRNKTEMLVTQASSAFDTKMILYSHANKTFTRKVAHLTSCWNWGFQELGSGLLHPRV